MAEQNFGSNNCDDSEAPTSAGSVPPIQWDTYPGNDFVDVMQVPFTPEPKICEVSPVSKIPGSFENDSLTCHSAIQSQSTSKTGEDLLTETVYDISLEIVSEEKNTSEIKDIKHPVVCSSLLDLRSDTADEVILGTPEELENLEVLELPKVVPNVLNVSQTESVCCRELYSEAETPDFLDLKNDTPTQISLNEVTDIFFDPNLSKLRNQNIDENQIDQQNLPGTALSESHSANSPTETAEQVSVKPGDEVDHNNPLGSPRKRVHGNVVSESPNAAKISPINVSAVPSSSEIKVKKSGHLVIEGLSPKSSANARKSGRSRHKHSNSVTAIKNSESHKHGDVTVYSKEDFIKSHLLSSADSNRQHEPFNHLTDDSNLCVGDVKIRNEVRTENEENVDGERSSYVNATKLSASQISDTKVHRSSSYRIATAVRHHRASSDDASASTQASDLYVATEIDTNSDFPSHLPPSHGPDSSSRTDLLISGSPHSDEASAFKVSKDSVEPPYGDEVPKKLKDHRGSSHHHSDHGRRLSLAKDLLLLSPTAVNAAQSWSDSTNTSAVIGAADLVTTPTKTSGIRRLKELFLDRSSPKDGTNTEPQHFTYDNQHTSASSTIFEGQLNSKNTMMDGKRSTERAWRSVHAILKGHHLFLHPDKASQNVHVYEHPISVRSALVDIAYDYVKRKNVFRLTTYTISEFLLEAEDQESMLSWIRYIQECGYSHSDKEFSNREYARQKRLVSQLASHAAAGRDSSHRKRSDSQRSPRLASRIPEPVGLARTRKTSRDLSKSPQRDNQITDEETAPHKSGGVALRTDTGISEHKSKDQTWKSKMVKKFKRLSSQSPAAPSVEQTGAFGVELDKCVPSANNEFVPLIVDACITIVESKGLTNRGIYRVPGNSAAISQLQAELNKDPTSINLESEKWQDVNAVISLLKLFFRELPYPLITKELYPSMIEANRVDDSTKRMLKIKRLIHSLPMHNFETLHFLARHLNKVASVGDVNMMDARNLAIIFGPTLLQPKQDMVNMVKDMSDQCRIVESIIQHCDWFFSSWDEDVNVPADGEKDSSTIPITGMDQQLLEKAEHMVLEEQALSSRRLWRPNAVRKANAKERYTSGPCESNNERNIDEEIALRIGLTGDKRSKNRNDEKNAKMRAKSVPPRPVSTLHVHGGKLVERMTDTAPAKRKNSSPVTINRRESAIPGGIKATSRHQFHRSSSEMSEKHYRVSSNAKGRQATNMSSSRSPALEQGNNKRKSISSHALFSSKLAQNQKPVSGLTPRGSQEKLGSPHSSRSSHISISMNTVASDVVDAKRKKGSHHHHHHVRTDGFGKSSHSKSSAGSKKTENLTRKVELVVADEEKNIADQVKTAVKQESEEIVKSENCKISLSELDTDPAGDIPGTQEPSVLLQLSDNHKVWNAADNTREDISTSESIRRSPTKTSGEAFQTLFSDSVAPSAAVSNRDLSVIPNDSGCLNIFTEKLNFNLEVSSKDRHSENIEIAELSLDQPVICEEKENFIDVVFSDATESNLVRLSPGSKSLVKTKVLDVAEEVINTTVRVSIGQDFDTLYDISQHLSPTPKSVLNSELGSSQKSQPSENVQLQYSSKEKQLCELEAEQKDLWSCTLSDRPCDRNLDPALRSANDSDDRVLKRTSSEPSIISAPVVTQSPIKISPRKEATRPKHKRSSSTSARSHSNNATSDRSNNTHHARRRCRGISPYESSRSLTYESSV